MQSSVWNVLAVQGEKKDLLFFTTERYKFCVLYWDASSKQAGCIAYLSTSTTVILHVMYCTCKQYHMSYVVASDNLQTRASGDLADRTGRPVEHGQIGIIDPDCRVLGVQMYDGLLKVCYHCTWQLVLCSYACFPDVMVHGCQLSYCSCSQMLFPEHSCC